MMCGTRNACNFCQIDSYCVMVLRFSSVWWVQPILEARSTTNPFRPRPLERNNHWDIRRCSGIKTDLRCIFTTNLVLDGTAERSLFAFCLQTVESIFVPCRIDKQAVPLSCLCSLLVMVQRRFGHLYEPPQWDRVKSE